jgi:uncharacterized protein
MSEAVTIVVRRKVKPGLQSAYEEWLKRLTEGAQKQFTGYLGSEFHRPDKEGGEYRSIFRFDSSENLKAFEESEFRKDMLAEGTRLFANEAAWQRQTGLEVWFDPPPGAMTLQPSPHRMVIVLTIVVFFLVILLNAVLEPLTKSWPYALRILAVVVVQVVLMTYLIMPRLTPLIARFIYPQSNHK